MEKDLVVMKIGDMKIINLDDGNKSIIHRIPGGYLYIYKMVKKTIKQFVPYDLAKKDLMSIIEKNS